MKKFTIIIILLMNILSIFMYSQENISNTAIINPYQEEIIGIRAGIGLLGNYYNSKFQVFENIINCGQFNNGSGLAYSGFVSVESRIFPLTHIGIQLGYDNRSGLQTIKSRASARNTDGSIVEVETENSIKSELHYITIQPEIRHTISSNFINAPLRVVAGFKTGFPIKSSYEQRDKILAPSNAVFITEIRTQDRLIAKGNIHSTNILYGFALGIENFLKISSRMYLIQQIMFDYYFNNIIEGIDWKIYGIRLEFGIRFDINNYIGLSTPLAPWK